MKALKLIVLTIISSLGAASASADNLGGCNTNMLTGRWVFATDVGHQALKIPNPPPPGDITAIGTMNVHRGGTLDGIFDVTFQGAAFRAAVPYSGTVTVNADCTGTLTFTTGAGTTRTDSIVVLNRYEIWGMSQDPNNQWTYSARRLAGALGFGN
jgi:hypothetical protein